MKLFILSCVLGVFLSCKGSDKESNLVKETELVKKEAQPKATDLEVYDFEGLKPFLNKQDDKIYVINFWATWCGPCVKELPYFEQLNENYKGKGVEVILVSLDFPSMYDTKLKPFIAKKGLKSKVLALNDPNENVWISAIDENWTGAIPATIIYRNNTRKFFEQSFTYEALEHEIKQLK